MLKETKYNRLTLIVSLGGFILFLFAAYLSTVTPTLNGYPPSEIAWLFFYDTLINSVAALFISVCLFFAIKKIGVSILRKITWFVYSVLVLHLGYYAWGSADFFFNGAIGKGYQFIGQICIMFPDCIFTEILFNITILFGVFFVYFLIANITKKSFLLKYQAMISILIFIAMGLIVNYFLLPYFISQNHF
jgi:hypothetical protein